MGEVRRSVRCEAQVKDAAGARRTVTREAASVSALAADLRAEGLLVLGVVAVDGTDGPSAWDPRWLLPMTAFDAETGFRQLAAMLRSGVTLLAALETVEEQSASPRAGRAWRRVRDRVSSGSGLSDAFAADGRFGDVPVQLVAVGERTGELDRALGRAADHLEGRRALRLTVLNALFYPFVAVALALAVSLYLVTVVIPKVAEFLRGNGGELPALTQGLVDASAWIAAHGWALGGSAAGAVALWFAVRLSEAGREAEDALLLRVPVAGKILRLSGTALFARAMQVTSEAGVTLLDALEATAGLLANRRFRRRVRAARAAVLRGSSLAEALAPAREFLPMLGRMAAVGEMTGSLAEAFAETARFHEAALAVAIKRFSVLIEPVMIGVTGGIVGFVYVAFFMALFALAGTR